MKTLPAAFALLALTTGASMADSVLSRVLHAASSAGSMTRLNGIFANIAETYDGTINGSIVNVLGGTTLPSANVAPAVEAVQQVQVDIGNLSTTVLGAVNTADSTLGANQKVTEAIRKRSRALAASITQIGGSASTSALVLNIASNVSDVSGSVTNQFDGLNGSIGNVSTTVLGAVNTGTITSGVGQTVQGLRMGLIGK